MSFELKFFVCRHVSIWGFQNRVWMSVRSSVCPSVRTSSVSYWNHPGFDNISPTLVSMERSSRVLQHENLKIWFFLSSKFNFVRTPSVRTYPEKRNHPGFVNISPTLVIDTSMARSSWVLQYGNPKIWFFQKSSKFNFDFYFDFCWRA